jgi:galactose mutarotase-like enzyme
MFEVVDVSDALPRVRLIDADAGSQCTVVPGRGALVISLLVKGREWLYLDEATLRDQSLNVRGGNPVLFPSPGKLEGDRFSCEGIQGSMKQHGVARNQPWREVGRGTDGAAWLQLELADNPATREQFPFPFRTRIRYALHARTLRLEIAVENPGMTPLPFGYGFHPYFAVAPEEKAATRIPTQATRAWDNVQKKVVPFTGLDLSGGEVDLHLEDHHSAQAQLETPHGTVQLRGSEEFGRWVIWTQPGKGFVCLEPWTAPGNALNTGVGLLHVPPGGRHELWLEVEVLP